MHFLSHVLFDDLSWESVFYWPFFPKFWLFFEILLLFLLYRYLSIPFHLDQIQKIWGKWPFNICAVAH